MKLYYAGTSFLLNLRRAPEFTKNHFEEGNLHALLSFQFCPNKLPNDVARVTTILQEKKENTNEGKDKRVTRSSAVNKARNK